MSSNFDKRLLSIDDDPTVLQVIQIALEREDWTVHTATCGREGVLKAAAKSPTVILSDISMPDMDGFETAHALRSNPLTQHIPLIFLTSLPESSIRQEATSLGVKHIIAKPFDPLTLSAQIIDALGWKS